MENDNYLFVTSLRATSIYVIKFNDKFDKILNEDRIFISERRIRDIEYDKDSNAFFLIFENTPSFAILSAKKNN